MFHLSCFYWGKWKQRVDVGLEFENISALYLSPMHPFIGRGYPNHPFILKHERDSNSVTFSNLNWEPIAAWSGYHALTQDGIMFTVPHKIVTIKSKYAKSFYTGQKRDH